MALKPYGIRLFRVWEISIKHSLRIYKVMNAEGGRLSLEAAASFRRSRSSAKRSQEERPLSSSL
jgi:hypothetical protein